MLTAVVNDRSSSVAKGWGAGAEAEVSYPGPCDVWGPPSLKNIKYTRMHYLKKIKSIIFSPDGPGDNLGGLAKMFLRAPLVPL